MDHLPDWCITEIRLIDYFVFDLPVSAFGYRDTMVIQICVEYCEKDDGMCAANVWACQKGAKSKHFIYQISLPVSDPMELKIFEALNQSDEFEDVLCDYIEEAAKHRIDK